MLCTAVCVWVQPKCLYLISTGTGSNTLLGQQVWLNGYLSGFLDDLVLYDVVLKDSDVRNLFNAYGYTAAALGTVCAFACVAQDDGLAGQNVL